MIIDGILGIRNLAFVNHNFRHSLHTCTRQKPQVTFVLLLFVRRFRFPELMTELTINIPSMIIRDHVIYELHLPPLVCLQTLFLFGGSKVTLYAYRH